MTTKVSAGDIHEGTPAARAVVVFSGGVDSVCYALRLQKSYNLYGITFSYGQKAGGEMGSARRFARRLELKKHRIVDVGFMRELYGSSNALTSSKVTIPERFNYSIVVPVRNAVFLTIAAAWAYTLGATVVAYGAHTGDTHYPDCRPRFTRMIQDALNEAEIDGIREGHRQTLEVLSPFINGYSKGDLIRYGYEKLGDDIFDTWSCYAEGRVQCGRCESCNNRRAAFADVGIKDGTRYKKS